MSTTVLIEYSEQAIGNALATGAEVITREPSQISGFSLFVAAGATIANATLPELPELSLGKSPEGHTVNMQGIRAKVNLNCEPKTRADVYSLVSYF